MNTCQAFGAADDVGGHFHVQRVHRKQYSGKYRGGRVAEHAAGGDSEQDSDRSVECDVDDMIAEGAQLVEIVVETKRNGSKWAVTEVRARFKHVAAPQILCKHILPVAAPVRVLVLRPRHNYTRSRDATPEPE